MKTAVRRALIGFLVLVWVLDPLAVKAEDYTYTTNNGTITITGYTGPGGDVSILDAINGVPVISIGERAFYDCTGTRPPSLSGSG